MGGLAGGKDGGTPSPKDGGTPTPKDGGTPTPKDGGTTDPKDGGKDGGGATVSVQLDRQTAEALLVALTQALGSSGGDKSTKSTK